MELTIISPSKVLVLSTATAQPVGKSPCNLPDPFSIPMRQRNERGWWRWFFHIRIYLVVVGHIHLNWFSNAVAYQATKEETWQAKYVAWQVLGLQTSGRYWSLNFLFSQHWFSRDVDCIGAAKKLQIYLKNEWEIVDQRASGKLKIHQKSQGKLHQNSYVFLE